MPVFRRGGAAGQRMRGGLTTAVLLGLVMAAGPTLPKRNMPVFPEEM
jgi:hypothetical protein